MKNLYRIVGGSYVYKIYYRYRSLVGRCLIAQSLRLMFPFIPNQVSMFLIGSITSATFVLATWRYGWKNGLVIAWIAPVVAHLQGMLPLPPFILITALGTTAYVFVAHWLQHKPKLLLIIVAALVKAAYSLAGIPCFSPCSNFHQRL